MNLFKLNYLILIFSFGFLSSNLFSSNIEKEKPLMASFIRSSFENYYAPIAWKTSSFNWDMSAELLNLESAAMEANGPEPFLASLKDFFKNTRDYHTGIYFYNNATSTLPLSIKYIDGAFYVAHLADSLPSNFPLQVGDKIITFGGRPVEQVALELMGNISEPSLTDWALAARKITRRFGASLDPMGQGSILIEGEQDGKKKFAQMVWNHKPNTMPSFGPRRLRTLEAKLDLDPRLPKDAQETIRKLYSYIETRSLKLQAFNYWQEAGTEVGIDPNTIGNKASFLPPMSSKIIWQAPEDGPWQAYIYMNDQRQLIGYIRIARYTAHDEKHKLSDYAKSFGEIINHMDQNTDALIIDQLNNPGGSVFYLYGLASMLTDKPLATPRHQFTIDAENVYEAQEFIKSVDGLIALASIFPVQFGTVDGYPLDLQFFVHMKSYYQFIVEQWKKGNGLTEPYFLYGVDYIQPHPKYNYSKKILMLTNELDFSGGDFFPSILQDNDIATIMGTTTAGAGGYVLSNKIRNRLGVRAFSYTGSLAFRPNGKPLENLGVSPDVPYQITAEDLAKSYKPFMEAIDKEIKALCQ